MSEMQETTTHETIENVEKPVNEHIEVVDLPDNDEAIETKTSSEYSAENIQVLEGLEAVRKRPGMYIGTVALRGLHHLIYEIVDNSVDEALAGYCTEINVTINKDNSVTVIDNGRGVPIGIHHKMGIPTVEVVYTILHAGGKFGGGGYKVSGGLHGVGASVVNALSDWLEVEVSNGEGVYKQRYEKGKTVTELEKIGDTKKTGTKVTFLPDASIFETFGQLMYVYAMSGNAIIAAPIVSSVCVVSVILARIFLKEKMNLKQYLAIISVIIGILVLAVAEVVLITS